MVGFDYVLSLTHDGGAKSSRMVVGSVRSSCQLPYVIQVKILPPRHSLSHHGRKNHAVYLKTVIILLRKEIIYLTKL